MNGTHGTGGSLRVRDGILPWQTLAGSQGMIPALRLSLSLILPLRKGTKGLNWWDLSKSTHGTWCCAHTSQHSMGTHPQLF